jgi:mutator protein MutT
MITEMDAGLYARLAGHLTAFERRELPLEDRRAAAVALTILPDEQGRPCFAITRRTQGLGAHAGQWALPGGRIDAGETPEEAALRELHEELGVELEPQQVLGQLDDFATRSGFVITPVVVFSTEALRFDPNPHEVAHAYRVPLEVLEAPEVPLIWSIPESDRPLLSVPIPMLETTIHSPTAAMLFQLREVALYGRATRVAHYEQPVFAWK